MKGGGVELSVLDKQEMRHLKKRPRRQREKERERERERERKRVI